MYEYNVIGIMSGTSLDGVDVALCNFKYENEQWAFKIIKAKTYYYTAEWKNKLSTAIKLSIVNFLKLHKEYGRFTGNIVLRFLEDTSIKIDFIASHGHTVIHQPNDFVTYQLGDGAELAATTGITTISDFRSLDVALGGQGAPLVPIGDAMLFSQYDFCLNLGGFANISYNNPNTSSRDRVAFDISPVNIILNYLAQKKGVEFDENGLFGKRGKLNRKLFDELNALDYYQKPAPKSLGKEWLDEHFIPIIENYKLSLFDLFRTVYEHVGYQISKAAYNGVERTIFATGGGAFNKFLIQTIQNYTKHKIIIPDHDIVNFKEALIFAFLGVLRHRDETNCLTTVTGARIDNIGGVIWKVNNIEKQSKGVYLETH